MSPHPLSSWLLACAFLSGLAGLVYEVVWLREVGLQFGNTLSATGTVLAVFMAGMALGSVWLGQRADRTEKPLGLYAGLEVGIGLSALVVPAGLRLIDHASLLLLPSLPGLVVQLPLTVLVLLIPTVGLGGTLPVLARCLPPASHHSVTTPGLIYGLATLGAASGACLAAFVLLPSLGSWHTNITAALINGLIGGGCFLLRGKVRSAETPARPPAPSSRQARQPRQRAAALSPSVVLICLGVSGYAALIYEVVWTRLLGLILENTVYAVSLMLSTFLLGLALGSFISTKLSVKSYSLAALLGGSQWAVALTSLLGVLPLSSLAWLVYQTYGSDGWGDSWLIFLSAQALLCTAVMLLPTIFLGMAFPLAWQQLSSQRLGTSLGRLLGANTLGAVLGSVSASFVLIPTLGLRLSLLGAALCNAAVGTLVLVHKRPRRPIRFVFTAAVLLSAVAYALPLDLTFQQLLAHGSREILYHREDGRGVVEVVEDLSTGVRSLLANRLRQEGADAPDDVFITRQQGYLPLFLHPAPHRLAVVGLGTGLSLAAGLLDRVEDVTVIEISPGVIEAARLFDRSSRAVLTDPKVRLVQADGRRFFRTSHQTYDVIVQDLFFPYRAGTGSLYTVEHYERLRRRLQPGGIAVQWVSLNQLTPRAFQIIARTFQHVFPHTSVWLVGGYGALVGGESDYPLDFANLRQAYAQAVSQHPDLGRTSPVDLLAAFVCGPDRVADWTAGAPFNTEDNGWIEYRSPLPFDQLYAQNDLAVASLDQLLAYREPPAVTNLDAPARTRLERAYQARTLALSGLMLLHQGQTTAAHAQYQQAYALNPKDAFAAHHMRDTWLASATDLVQQERYRDAQELVFRVLSLSPDSLPGRFLLAQILLAEGQPQRALAEFQTIASRAPAYPGVQDALSYAQRVSHRTDPSQGEAS